MMSKFVRLLSPSAASVRRLAADETDPRLYREFEPITLGPFLNGTLILAIGAAALVTLPFRLVAALFRKS